MEELKSYIEYIEKISEDAKQKYIKAIAEVKAEVVSGEIFSGIPNMDLMLGMKSILKNSLHTLSASFLATTLSFQHQDSKKLQYIAINYGEEISRIIEGVQKIRSIKHVKALDQPDMQRKLILSVARDTRSLLVLLAESLYLLRHYDKMLDFEQKTETLNGAIAVFIPIAHRLGFYKIKSEMEDLVLSIREPEMYLSIKNKLANSEVERNKIINKFIAPIILELNAHGLQYTIKSRLKSVNSIYNKMKKQDIPFEKVYDLWAIRLILDSEPNKEKEKQVCWHAYSIVTNLYEPNLSRMRDWITVPKSSGYESLHTTVKSEEGRWVEVQIRTQRMDEEAENGMAAHWRYKGGKMTKGIDYWLSAIRNAVGSSDSQHNNASIQPEKFANEVFVFTPGGDLKKLKYGATVLDFAYAIHSDVGNKCINAKVNGKITPIKQALRNGDQVHINTSKNQKPSPDWMKWVVSARTKTKIRKALDENKTKEIIRGKEILERKFKNWKIDLTQDVIDNLVEQLEIKEHYDLFFNVSLGKLDPLDLKRIAAGEEEVVEKPELSSDTSLTEIEEDELKTVQKDILVIDKIDHINFKLAKCCNPIQGDRIFGFVTVTKGITIHRNSCPNAAEMKKRYPYRIIKAKWKASAKKINFKTGIRVLGIDSMGLANKITQVVSNDMKVNIVSMNFDQKNGQFEGKLGLLVRDYEHLELLLDRIKAIKGVNDAFRQD
jgi:GTP pyrophosphokinase